MNFSRSPPGGAEKDFFGKFLGEPPEKAPNKPLGFTTPGEDPKFWPPFLEDSLKKASPRARVAQTFSGIPALFPGFPKKAPVFGKAHLSLVLLISFNWGIPFFKVPNLNHQQFFFKENLSPRKPILWVGYRINFPGFSPKIFKRRYVKLIN